MPTILRYLGKFLFDVAVGVTVWGLTEGQSNSHAATVNYTNSPPARTATARQVTNTFKVIPPPPAFNKDSVVAAYGRQFQPVKLPASASDFLMKRQYIGSDQSRAATLTISHAVLRNDTIGFTYRLRMTDEDFNGTGYFLPGNGLIDLGLEKHGFEQGWLAKLRHINSGIELIYIHLPGKSSNNKLEFLDNEQP